ncbi:hypothetical protein ACE1CI_06580 [Aerosakkonemataceae cyanobacterium BLCC-F50]|uniref:Uncharacterized protein n=1 Tax=Floridaenema flaviceps BLCC-F50 TaxID=3153642 RepID=A0ABV4XM34_9CYAN
MRRNKPSHYEKEIKIASAIAQKCFSAQAQQRTKERSHSGRNAIALFKFAYNYSAC